MIKVGIHENVELVKAEINDKGTLIIGLKKGGGKSLAASLADTSDESSAEETQDFFVWPLAMGDYTKTGADVAKDMKSMTRMLNHILKAFLSTEEMTKESNPFFNIDIDGKSNTELEQILVDRIEDIYANISTQFVAMVTPFIGKGDLFRVKLNRQSKLKAYPSLPKVGQYADLTNEGFWESMDVKAEISNVKYSNYELGFRKGDKTKPTGVDLSSSAQIEVASEPDPEQAKEAEAMFGDTPQE